MARVVFFSFHHGGDSKRIGVVRNHHITKDDFQEAGYIDGVDWEEIKLKSDESIKKWINQQLVGTTVTIVLIGEKTSERPWVNYEIEQSFKRGNALLGVYIHNIKGLDQIGTAKGNNPFANFVIEQTGVKLSDLVSTYDWVENDGYNNFSSWVENAYSKWSKGSDWSLSQININQKNINTEGALTNRSFVKRELGEQFIEDFGIETKISHHLEIDCEIKQDGYRPFFLKSLNFPLKKKRGLEFFISKCTVPRPFKVKWKIKNSGKEAESVGVLRGEIVDDLGNERRKESTSYTGSHYVECYIIKDNICVAKNRIDVPIGTF